MIHLFYYKILLLCAPFMLTGSRASLLCFRCSDGCMEAPRYDGWPWGLFHSPFTTSRKFFGKMENFASNVLDMYNPASG